MAAPPTTPDVIRSSLPTDRAPSPYPRSYGPPPKEDTTTIVVIILVIGTLMVLPVIAAIWYSFQIPPTSGSVNGPRAMGVSISRSPDGTNWSLLIVSSPTGLSTSATSLTILATDGSTALPATSFASLSYSAHGVAYASDGDTTIEAAEYLLIDASRYATGYQVRIGDASGILFAGTLQ